MLVLGLRLSKRRVLQSGWTDTLAQPNPTGTQTKIGSILGGCVWCLSLPNGWRLGPRCVRARSVLVEVHLLAVTASWCQAYAGAHNKPEQPGLAGVPTELDQLKASTCKHHSMKKDYDRIIAAEMRETCHTSYKCDTKHCARAQIMWSVMRRLLHFITQNVRCDQSIPSNEACMYSSKTKEDELRQVV